MDSLIAVIFITKLTTDKNVLLIQISNKYKIIKKRRWCVTYINWIEIENPLIHLFYQDTWWVCVWNFNTEKVSFLSYRIPTTIEVKVVMSRRMKQYFMHISCLMCVHIIINNVKISIAKCILWEPFSKTPYLCYSLVIHINSTLFAHIVLYVRVFIMFLRKKCYFCW